MNVIVNGKPTKCLRTTKLELLETPEAQEGGGITGRGGEGRNILVRKPNVIVSGAPTKCLRATKLILLGTH